MKKRRQIKNSGYSSAGASLIKKTLKSWLPTHFSAKSDIDMNLSTLRARSHDLYIGSAIGRAAVQTVLNGTINEGLQIFPRLDGEKLGMDKTEVRAWESKVKQEFELWAETVDCDFYRRNTFLELQKIAFLNSLTDGDCFCLFRRRTPSTQNPYSLKLQLIEAGRVSNPQGQVDNFFSSVEMSTKSGGRIVNGIEVDKHGTLQKIWISNRIFDEWQSATAVTKWRSVRFFGELSGEQNLCMVCDDDRTEQFRGVPLLAPVIEVLKNLDRYTEAELTAAILKTYLSFFFTQPNTTNSYDLDTVFREYDSDDIAGVQIGPATMTLLPPGLQVESINPTGASSTFESFTVQLLKQVGAALNLPYEVLMKNFQSSYSASKAALLQAENEFKQRRQSFITDFCEPIYRQWLMEAVSIGRVSAPGFFTDVARRKLFCAADWFNSANHSLDALKEVQASALKIQLGLSTHEREAAELNGTNFEENIRQLLAEQEIFNTNGG